MVMVVRHTELQNTTGAAIIPGGAPVLQGQDYAAECINLTLATADVGTAAGQTQNAAGMIFGEFRGAAIKRVISATVFRTSNGFDYRFLGSNTVINNIGFSITTLNNVSTLRMIDGATAAGGQLAAGDRIVVLVELGNS